MTKVDNLTIVKTLFLKAPPEHIWSFLTDENKLASWFYEADTPMHEGGDYTLLTNTLGKEGERICWGTIKKFEPPTRFVHTFTHEYLKGVETLCDWTLRAVEGGTVLTLVHSGFEKAAEAFTEAADHDKGWDEHFIRLRRVTL